MELAYTSQPDITTQEKTYNILDSQQVQITYPLTVTEWDMIALISNYSGLRLSWNS